LEKFIIESRIFYNLNKKLRCRIDRLDELEVTASVLFLLNRTDNIGFHRQRCARYFTTFLFPYLEKVEGGNPSMAFTFIAKIQCTVEFISSYSHPPT